MLKFGKCIISEELVHVLPEPLINGTHYNTFHDIDECVKICKTFYSSNLGHVYSSVALDLQAFWMPDFRQALEKRRAPGGCIASLSGPHRLDSPTPSQLVLG